MIDTAVRLYGPAQPGTGNATAYTVDASAQVVIRNIQFTNTTGTDATVSISINGTAATASNCLFYLFTVAASSSFPWPVFIVLNETDTLQILQGTGSAITVTISGVKIDNA